MQRKTHNTLLPQKHGFSLRYETGQCWYLVIRVCVDYNLVLQYNYIFPFHCLIKKGS